jgi:hypothetical protein
MSDTTSKNVRLSEESEASHLLINVAQVLVEVIHDVEDRKVPEDTIAGQRGGEVDEGRSASGVLQVQSGLRVSTNRSSSESPEVLLVLVLPVRPDLVNHRVVQHEHGIIRRPFGSGDTSRRDETLRASTAQITSNNHVDRAMRTGCALEQGMESHKVTDEPVNQQVDTVLSEVVPEIKRSRRSTVTEGISDKGPLGEVPSEVVGDGVGKWEVLGKGTSRDLEIVIGVTPSTHSARRGIVPDRGIDEVGACVDGPVPVRLSTLVVALGPQRTLKFGDISAMPRQKETSEMNQWVQVHVHVNEIIEVGAIGVDGRDLGDSDIDSGRQGVLMRHRVEALDSIGPFFTFVAGEGSPLTPDDGVLATALLGSRLGSRSSVHGREERKKKNEENVLCEADGHRERPLERGREGKR